MIEDTNTLSTFFFHTFEGMVSGDFILLGILIMLIIGIALILAKARASTVIMVETSIVFIFALLIPSAFMFVYWIVILASIFVLINGLRKWITGQ
jgi:hypothetical protein